MFPELGNNTNRDDQTVSEWLNATSNILTLDNFQTKRDIKPHQDELLQNFKTLVNQGLRPSLRKKLATTLVKFHNVAETFTVYIWLRKVNFNQRNIFFLFFCDC